MDWDNTTQTGARTSGVEEQTPRMAVRHESTVPTQSGTLSGAAECTKGRCKPMCCAGHAWCWLNLSNKRKGTT